MLQIDAPDFCQKKSLRCYYGFRQQVWPAGGLPRSCQLCMMGCNAVFRCADGNGITGVGDADRAAVT